MKNANSAILDNTYRLRSSIALSYTNNRFEFFKTNIRESLVLQIEYNLIDFLSEFNGYVKLKDIIKKFDFKQDDIIKLVDFLHLKHILIKVDSIYPENLLSSKYRLINFLEEYCYSTREVLQALEHLAQKWVFVVGLGAVGTWIVDILARCGVKKFILVDNDKVELSNLHRQDFYTEQDIGRYKIDCVEERLQEIDDVELIKIYEMLDSNFFIKHKEPFSLAINCADFPNVDTTTKIIGTECMKRKIPHIIGGGYNLHLTLIGQSILPFVSACHECFDMALEKINAPYVKNFKKLHRQNRKIGSFTPLCTIAASLATLDAFKILCGFTNALVNTNKRIEFSIRDMDIKMFDITRNSKCKICGNEV